MQIKNKILTARLLATLVADNQKRQQWQVVHLVLDWLPETTCEVSWQIYGNYYAEVQMSDQVVNRYTWGNYWNCISKFKLSSSDKYMPKGISYQLQLHSKIQLSILFHAFDNSSNSCYSWWSGPASSHRQIHSKINFSTTVSSDCHLRLSLQIVYNQPDNHCVKTANLFLK